MQKYSEFSPTGFDRKGAFLRDKSDWLVVPVSQTRDSGPLAESNFAAALEMLGGESEACEVHRFGHWGPGWFEIVIIDPNDDKLVAIAQDIEASLENYPVLDDEDLSRREHDEYVESWDSWARRDYVRGLEAELLKQYPNGISEDFTDDELIETLSELTSEEVDAFRDKAAQAVNWEYQSESDGVAINVEGLIEKTDYDALAELLIQATGEINQAKEITRLCRYLGASQEAIAMAIQLKLVLVSEIQNIIQSQTYDSV
jgi:hypothetical protein